MKTIKNKNSGVIKRVDDKEANNLVSMNYLGWEYCPKKEWKELRGNVTTSSVVENVESNISDKKLRKQRKEQKRQKHESRK